MSDDELQRLRERKLAELQQQRQAQAEAQISGQQQAAYDAQKQALLSAILSSDARVRLTNIKLARPEFANALEMQLINAYQSGALRGQVPLSDEKFKNLLMQLQQSSQKRDPKIKFR